MDKAWEDAVAAALKPSTSAAPPPPPPRTLTLDGAVKCSNGRLPAPPLLERFPSLELLSLANVRLCTLEGFPRLPRLRRLVLSDNRVAGGLAALAAAGLAALRHLDLSNNRIAAAEDLAPLAALGLESLDLYECPVTRVEGYRSKVFGMIPSLKYLDKIDADGKERLDSDDEEEDEEEDEEADEEEIDEEEGEDEEEEEEEDGEGSDGEGEDDESNEEESEGEELDEHGKDQSCNGAPPNPHSTPNKRKRDEEGNINGKSNESSRPLNTTSG
ncbi:acidic leucine-rich nuclear phosphoprotein 32-related protein 2-like [Ananas comosus]|uniref:Acidic leucine-rich nuclear phosphoprotein 32-related protein 2-like n=1 Tax=Ananas comosus TaxID=4615 RepID=A0A6P5FQ34_ANACO|nr:acidic leucine-rich nuclear phosphoprotein 32-related protein 2-like [Ananas comosus]